MLFSNSISPYPSAAYNHYRYTDIIWCVAVAVPFVYALIDNAADLLPTFLWSVLLLQCWQLIFEPLKRHILPGTYTLVYAMLFSLLLPMDVSIWTLVLCVSFGSVFGERVFGGRGFTFLNPVTVGLAFYLFSKPIEISSTGASLIPLLLIVFIALVLIVLELVSWRSLLGIALGLVLSAWVINPPQLEAMLSSSSIILPLILLGGDPGSGGSTNPSRWLHGMLCGFLLVFLYNQTSLGMHATLFAVLLASLSAPLLDYLVILVHTARRRRRYE